MTQDRTDLLLIRSTKTSYALPCARSQGFKTTAPAHTQVEEGFQEETMRLYNYRLSVQGKRE